MKYTYYGHSCFLVELNGVKILFDPFITGNDLAKHIDINSIKCDYILLSHGHFDHVLDAALVVSYLALREGDAVGLLASGGERRWVAPQRGAGALDVLLRASYDVQPQPVADAVSALSNLGYPQAQAVAAVAAASREAGEGAGTAQLIKLGLRELAK